MELEDPRLHETAEMWKSVQHQINMGALAFMVIFIIMGFAVGYVFSASEMPVNLTLTIIAAVIVVPGTFVAIYVAYTNLDQKDHWTLALPFNKVLYDRLETTVEGKFIEKGYNYRSADYPFFSTFRDYGTGNLCGRAFAIRAPGGPEVEVRFGLQVIRGKNHTTYLFPMQVRNIRKENIDCAREIQRDLMEVLISVDFLSYTKDR